MRPILAVGTLDNPMRQSMKQRIPSMTTVSSHVSSMNTLLLLVFGRTFVDDMAGWCFVFLLYIHRSADGNVDYK